MSKIDVDVLRNLSPMENLTADNLRELSVKSNVINIAKGKLLFKAGSKDGHNIYLLRGEAELYDQNKNSIQKISADSEEARQAISPTQPRLYSCRALSDCQVLSVDSNLLDIMLTWSQTGSYEVESLEAVEDGQEGWMSQILQCKAFHEIPPANIQALFLYMEKIDVSPGDKVIKQGDDGDYFYVIKSGKALVTRASKSNPKGIKLAELHTGDSFGEEALISENKRNATITMLTRGQLVRLAKENFIKLLNEPVLHRVDKQQGKVLTEEKGARWLDVRLPTEFKTGHIEDAQNIPLISLRIKCEHLDKDTHWILCCDTGRRSSAAAYLMAERGFETSILDGGLLNQAQARAE